MPKLELRTLVGSLAILLAACSGGPSASNPPSTPSVTPPVPTQAASATPASTPPPSQASSPPPTAAASDSAVYSCSDVPTPGPDGIRPVTSDQTLKEAIPDVVGGQPVTNVESMLLVESVCIQGGEELLESLLASFPTAFSPQTLSVATATVVVDDEAETLVAFRAPGSDAGALINDFLEIMAALGADLAQFDRTETTVGGKPVTVFTDETDPSQTTYIYTSDDMFFGAGGVTESQAEGIFAPLP